MKNPMTLQEQHQALDDVDAGHPMQYRPFHSKNHNWLDCMETKRSLNFMVNEYRRKPELLELWVNVHQHGVTFSSKKYEDAVAYGQYYSGGTIHKMVEDTDWVKPEPEPEPEPEPIIMYANIYKIGAPACHSSLADAKESKVEHFVRHVRLIEDPDWVEPSPAMPSPEDKNPWRPIARGEWPKCAPRKMIEIKFEDGRTEVLAAGNVNWNITYAITWRYAEDE